MKSYTGLIFTLGKGTTMSGSTKQRGNSRRSIEEKLNATDDKISITICVNIFLEYQDLEVRLSIVYQDNTRK